MAARTLRLTAAEAAPRLPALLDPVLRSGERGDADRFLPTGYLKPIATYELGASRSSDGTPAVEREVGTDGELLLLELADGSVLITSPRGLAEALADVRPDLLAPDGSVSLDALLAAEAGTAPASRSVAGAAGRLISRIFAFAADAAPDTILLDALKIAGRPLELGVSRVGVKALMQAVENQLDQPPGLYAWKPTVEGVAGLTPVPKDIEQWTPAGPMLVFVHGTASSSRGSFGELRSLHGDDWAAVEKAHPGGVYAFEHRTLSESPIDNALALAHALPRGATISLVSHSRGGMVADLMCLGDFDGLIERYCYGLRGVGIADRALSDKIVREMAEAHEEQRGKLRQLAVLLRERQIVVRRYVRVACPASGTLLASGNFDVFLSGLLTLIGAVPFFLGSPFYAAFKRVVIEIARHRTNPRLVPGIEAMLPDSPLARLLGEAPLRGQPPAMAVIAGDIEGGSLLKRLGVLLTDTVLFDQEANDLVVDTAAMLSGVAPKAAARVRFARGPDVSHFRYFVNVDTRRALVDWLSADQPAALKTFEALPSPAALAEALEKAQAEAQAASRGGEVAERPVVVVLPGVMGTHLTAGANDRVWFDPLDLAAGGLAKIAWGKPGVEAEALFGMFYDQLCARLKQTHRVERFAYDWRQPLDVLADRLGEFLDRLLRETQQPVRLLAHSMGGLVVRACIHRRRAVMDAVMAREGARLVMLGTPNRGAPSMIANLIGKGDTLRMLVRLDVKHNMQQVLDFVAGFRGALQLLPCPGYVDPLEAQAGVPAVPPDEQGRVWQLTKTWATLAGQVTDRWFGDGLVGRPDGDTLKQASWLWEQDLAHPDAVLPKDYAAKTSYVFGVAANTPCGVRLVDGRLRIVGTPHGDGTVPWSSGRLDNIGRYYWLPAEHGDLPSTAEYFPQIVELLSNGATTGLSTTPPATRAIEAPQPRIYDAGPPRMTDAESLQRALLGGSMVRRLPQSAGFRLSVGVKAADLRLIPSPILVGQFEQDPIAGPQAIIDADLLGGDLTERYNLGLYAGPLGTATVVLRGDGLRDERPQPTGAVVTGLGPYDGGLTPGRLLDAIRTGVLRYLLQVADMRDAQPRDEPCELPLASVLIGYNSSANLGIATSVEALVRGVLEANRKFAETTRIPIRVSRLEIVELYLDSAIGATYALNAAAPKLQALALANGTQLEVREQLDQNDSVRRRLLDGSRSSYWPRLMITAVDDGSGAAPADADRLRFLYVGQRARAESVALQKQPGLVERLVRQQIRQVTWQPGFGRMLFQLLVPHDFKEAARQLDRVVLVVDSYTANLPWELMLADETAGVRPAGGDESLPMALKAPVVRQFSTAGFRRQVRQAGLRSALVVGNPSVEGFEQVFLDAKGNPVPRPPVLDAAEAEAKAVDETLRSLGFDVKPVIGEDRRAADVLSALYEKPWRILHISAHGVFEQRHVDKRRRSGVVLSDGLLITAVEIGAMEVVPELVFLNCCHLGKVDHADPALTVGEGASRLAASVARELIDIGVRCVVVAGWAVNDQHARVFGETFYRALLLRQKPFGDAVHEARQAAWESGRQQDITWGAFQAYGDPGWLADASAERGGRPPPPPRFVSIDEACDELLQRSGNLLRRGEAHTRDHTEACVQQVEVMLEQRCPPGWRKKPKLLSALGFYYEQLNDLQRAHAALLAAVQSDTSGGEVAIARFETLAKIEARLGEWQLEVLGATADDAWFDAALAMNQRAVERLDRLDALADLHLPPGSTPPTRPERAGLRGSTLKRRASLHARRVLTLPADGPAELVALRDQHAAAMKEALRASVEAYRSAEGSVAGGDLRTWHAINRLQLNVLSDWPGGERTRSVELAQRCRQLAEQAMQTSADPFLVQSSFDAQLAESMVDGSFDSPLPEHAERFAALERAFGEAMHRAAFRPVQRDTVLKALAHLERIARALHAHRPDEAPTCALMAQRLRRLAQAVQPAWQPDPPVGGGPEAAAPAAAAPAAAPPAAPARVAGKTGKTGKTGNKTARGTSPATPRRRSARTPKA